MLSHGRGDGSRHGQAHRVPELRDLVEHAAREGLDLGREGVGDDEVAHAEQDPGVDGTEEQRPERPQPVVLVHGGRGHEGGRDYRGRGSDDAEGHDAHAGDEVDERDVYGRAHDDLGEVAERRVERRQALDLLEVQRGEVLDAVQGGPAEEHAQARGGEGGLPPEAVGD